MYLAIIAFLFQLGQPCTKDQYGYHAKKGATNADCFIADMQWNIESCKVYVSPALPHYGTDPPFRCLPYIVDRS